MLVKNMNQKKEAGIVCTVITVRYYKKSKHARWRMQDRLAVVSSYYDKSERKEINGNG